MLVRRTLSVILLLAVVLIAGTFASAPAMAHAGHSHSASQVGAGASSTTSDIDRALVEQMDFHALMLNAESSPDPQLPVDGQERSCDGRCCALGVHACCGFASSAPVALASRPSAGNAPTIPPSDQVRDGLAPESLLRPPRSFA